MEIEKRNELVLKNQDLVWKIAHELKCAYNQDAVQEGFIGLMEALDRFDESRGVALSTYAVPYIKGKMLKFLYHDFLIPMNRSSGGKYKHSFFINSLEEGIYIDSEGNEVTLGDVISNDEDSIDTDRIDLMMIIDSLDAISKRIWKLACEGYSQREISEKVGISSQGVQRTLSKIQIKIGGRLNGN